MRVRRRVNPFENNKDLQLELDWIKKKGLAIGTWKEMEWVVEEPEQECAVPRR